MSYEVWEKSALGARKGVAVRVHYTLDSAIISAKELSNGSTATKIWNDKKKVAGQTYPGAYEDVDIPNAVAVVERSDKQSRVRGWGIDGKFIDAVDCKRCQNSGSDPNAYNLPCNSCKGSSYRPKV